MSYISTPDATTTTTGKVQLAGDLSGTAAAPTVGAAKISPGKLATGAATAAVATSETTTSTTYADLTTTTDTVTVTIGANGLALVAIHSYMQNSLTTTFAYVGIDVSGATTEAANDAKSIQYLPFTINGAGQYGTALLYTGLAAGSTTFKMKYKVAAGTGTFQNRRISVVPL